MLLLTSFCIRLQAQNIIYSELVNRDIKNMRFEIIGNVSGNYLIYKNYNNEHYVTVYDDSMRVKNNVHLDFMRDRLLNIDFQYYGNKAYLIYQYQKNSTIYCNISVLDGQGNLLLTDQTVDTTRVGFFASNQIYGVSFAEDRNSFLIYKTQRKNDNLMVTTRTLSPSLEVLDSSRNTFGYDHVRETYKDLKLANDGRIVFIKDRSETRSDFTTDIWVYQKLKGENDFHMVKPQLGGKKLDDTELKIDNINRQYVLIGFSAERNSLNLSGLFSARVPMDTATPGIVAFHTLTDSVKYSVLDRGTSLREAFNRFYLKDIVLRKDGSFLLLTQEEYEEFRGGNHFNRFNNGYYSPYNYSDYYYYYYNPRYYNYYNYYGQREQEKIYYSNDVAVFDFDKNMKLQRSAVIEKSQNTYGTKNYLGFFTMNRNTEIDFLFLQNDRNRQVLSNTSMKPDGSITRYPTLKSRERGFEFMPSFSKQVGARQVLMPATYRNNIAFVKIEFQ